MVLQVSRKIMGFQLWTSEVFKTQGMARHLRDIRLSVIPFHWSILQTDHATACRSFHHSNPSISHFIMFIPERLVLFHLCFVSLWASSALSALWALGCVILATAILAGNNFGLERIVTSEPFGLHHKDLDIEMVLQVSRKIMGFQLWTSEVFKTQGMARHLHDIRLWSSIWSRKCRHFIKLAATIFACNGKIVATPL